MSTEIKRSSVGSIMRQLPGKVSRGARVAAMVLSCATAVILGFVVVSPDRAERLIVEWGYYYLLAVFALWLWIGRRVVADAFRERGFSVDVPGRLALVAAGCSLFALSSDDRGHKILFDEYVIQGTAWHLHATKEVGAPVRAYDIAGTWTTIDAYLDKRPFFYALLVSLAHDLTGYRLENAFLISSALAVFCVVLTGWIALALTGRRDASALAMVLLATTPLFGQNASGSGLEMLNLTMIAVVAASGIFCLRSPWDANRQSFLAVGAVLLAQSRYESALFTVPVAAILITAWRRAGRVSLPWPVICAPLLLIPYAWHGRVVDAKPQLWELREGDSARFAWRHLQGNLEGALEFFLSVAPEQPGSLALVLTGGLGAVLLLGHTLNARGRIRSAAPSALAWIGTGVAVHFVLILFYYWARFDEPVTARFALPTLLMLALLAAVGLRLIDRRSAWLARLPWAAWAVWMAMVALPTYAQRLYSQRNLVRHEIEWELSRVRERESPVLVLTSKATLPHLLHRIPALHLSMARLRGAEIAWHMERGTFREVLVSQVIRPITPQGSAGVDPADELPDGFRLETIERKRFGARWVRLSRLVAVEGTAAATRPAD